MRKQLVFLFALCFLCLAGCDRKAPAAPAPLPEVKGFTVKEYPYTPAQVVIAEIKPFDEVNLVARVEGFLRKRHFKEGSRVKKGQLLFEIEPELYRAKVKAAQAKLTRAQVASKNADTDYKRQRQLLTTKAVSERTFDKVEATLGDVTAHIEQIEKGTKIWEAIFVPLMKTKNKEEKLRQLYPLIAKDKPL